MKNYTVLLLAAAGAAVYFLLFRHKAAAAGGAPAGGGGGGVSYVPRLSTPEASPAKKGNPLLSNLAQTGTNVASSLISSLLGKGGGGGGGGGGGIGAGFSRGSTSAPSSSASLRSTSGQVNQPMTWTDPQSGNTYDLWSGELLSGAAAGAGVPYTPEASPSSVDISGDQFNSTPDNFSGDNYDPFSQEPSDPSNNNDLVPIDFGGDFG